MPTDFIINERGEIVRRVFTDTPIAINSTVINALVSRCYRKIAFIGLSLAQTPIELLVGDSILVFAELPQIHLHCPFKLTRDPIAVLTPAFIKRDQDTTLPILELDWTPPLTTFFVVEISQRHRGVSVESCNLYFAQHTDKLRFFLPPLPNIYDDARICMGEEFTNSSEKDKQPGIVEAFNYALASFQKSTWNSDLLSTERAVACQKLIRFSVEKFEQCPPQLGNGETLEMFLPKISTEISTALAT